jgi:hypothetical protein
MKHFTQFLASNPTIELLYNQFLETQKKAVLEASAEKVGQIAEILKGKYKGTKGKVQFIGLTRFDRMAKSEEPSVCLVAQDGEKYWTKKRNTRALTDQAV